MHTRRNIPKIQREIKWIVSLSCSSQIPAPLCRGNHYSPLLESFQKPCRLYEWMVCRVTWEEGTLTEGLPPSDVPVGTSMRRFLDSWLIQEGPDHCEGCHPGYVVLDCLRRQAEQALGSKPVLSSMFREEQWQASLGNTMCYFSQEFGFLLPVSWVLEQHWMPRDGMICLIKEISRQMLRKRLWLLRDQRNI